MTTQRIADFVAQTPYEALPPKAVDMAKLAIMDAAGAALAGCHEPVSEILGGYARELGGLPEASVIGRGLQTSAPLAALVNGVMAHALDFDDGSYSWVGHPTVVLMPTVFALAQKENLSGKAVLTAYILGFEAGARIGRALGADAYRVGWHNTSVVGVMGAAVSAARLLGLDAEKIKTALGIAASLASGLRQNFGTMTKPFHAGAAAQSGITAALLAQKGFSADPNILEAPMGYGQAFSRSFRPAELDWRPGDPFDIIVNGLCFKPYSSCRFTHHLIDGVLQLVHAHEIQARDVVRVECRVAPIANQVLIYHRPHTALEGKFSMEYCVARALLDREVRLDHFTDDQVCQKEIQDLIPKITPVQADLTAEDSFEKGEALPPAEIVIELKSGDRFSRRVTTPKGDPGNPMTTKELTDKFKDCARRILPSEEIDQTLQLFLELETLPNMWPLMERLTPARAQADDTR